MAKKKRVARSDVSARVSVAPSAMASEAVAPTPSEALFAAFRENDKLRGVIKEELGRIALDSAAVDARVAAAFKKFRPTRFTAAQRVPRNYLAPGEDLAKAQEAIVSHGLNAMRETSDQHKLTIQIDDSLASFVDTTTATDDIFGTMEIVPFVGALAAQIAVPPLRKSAVFTVCDAERQTRARMAAIEGTDSVSSSNAGASPTAASPAPDSPTTQELVARHVHTVMSKAAPPEEQVRFDLPKRATQSDADAAAMSFQLRAGASDVTSYHDFHTLQIAFEHIWTEIFDGRLYQLGHEVYREYVKALAATGRSVASEDARVISSIADLQQLLADIRRFSSSTDGSLPFDAPTATPLEVIRAKVAVISGLTGSDPNSGPFAGVTPPNVIEGAQRLSKLLEEIDTILAKPHSFTVFENRSINFGIMVTYRQTWKPESYQVGDLVSTIPLAPREVRRYTTRRVSKKTRAVKELEENVRTTKTEADSTSRVEREIITKAEEKTNFSATTHEAFGTEGGMKVEGTQQAGGDQTHSSAQAKKHFHEAVLKSAQEYRQQNRMEIDTSTSEETEDTTFHEIQNPNDELTVTYLFYELQRTYRISEKIHKVTPVVLVANEVPKPNEITDAWLMRYDWIVRRVLLDDSFRSSLDYLTKSFVGAEINIRLLENNVAVQKQVVDGLKQQVEAQSKVVEKDERDLQNTTAQLAESERNQAMLSTVKRIFDPLQIGGSGDTGTVTQAQTMVDYWQETVDRAEREKSRLLTQLGVATTALQVAIDKLSAAIKEHYDRVTEIDRLRIHIKENVLYYMQAIWNHEPTDQRYFRIHNIDVPALMPSATAGSMPIKQQTATVIDTLNGQVTHTVSMPMDAIDVSKRKLVEVADLDSPLGYKGNYAIYPLKQNNYLTLHMMQDYLEFTGELTVRDPDAIANYSVDELQELAACLFKRNRAAYDHYRAEIEQLIFERLSSSRPEDDRVVIPMNALYIDALVGTHPLLEDFKQIHRALDVKKVQAEVRRTELENVRLAARALEGQYDDPDIDRKIIIEGQSPPIAVQPDTT